MPWGEKKYRCWCMMEPATSLAVELGRPLGGGDI